MLPFDHRTSDLPRHPNRKYPLRYVDCVDHFAYEYFTFILFKYNYCYFLYVTNQINATGFYFYLYTHISHTARRE